MVSALEIFEEATGQARKAPIFSTDVLTASRERSSAASPEEALAMSMDRLRRVDLDLIAVTAGRGHRTEPANCSTVWCIRASTILTIWSLR